MRPGLSGAGSPGGSCVPATPGTGAAGWLRASTMGAMEDREPAPPASWKPRPANRLGLDYIAEARRLGPPPAPIIDVHTHVNGGRAARVFGEVMDRFGVQRTYTQTQLAEAGAVSDVLGDRVRFIAIPEYMAQDRLHAHTEGFLDNIREFHDRFGARVVKLWAAPRIRDFFDDLGPEVLALDGPWRTRAAELAQDLGMMFMTHVADPDTWFATHYSDASRYGTKLEQYEPFERMLERFTNPWIAAHMGGWPEDLEFLDGLLSRHPHLHLDTSATKWMVRELSRHTRDELKAFLRRWKGRILFGSDIVTIDLHLEPTDPEVKAFGAQQASSPAEADELYASRYWALRTMWETAYRGESPIADPDLHMVDPATHDEMSAPMLRGFELDRDLLESLYNGAAKGVVERWEREHP